MKRIVTFLLIFMCCLLVQASSQKLSIKNLNLTSTQNPTAISSLFTKEYLITDKITDLEGSTIDTLTALSKKTTYLLLGEINQDNQDYELFTARKKELLNLRYAPDIPLNSAGEPDRESQAYKDDLVTGYNIPGMLKKLAELNIKYFDTGQISVLKTADYYVTKTILTDVELEEINSANPKQLNQVTKNLTLIYFYKAVAKDYKLYWIMAQTDDAINTYFANVKQTESKGLTTNNKYYSSDSLYDYSQLQALSDSVTQNIYQQQQNKIVKLDTIYDKAVMASATGFFIAPGYIATTWHFVETSLAKGQGIIITDAKNNIYEMAGLVTYSAALDIAIIKLNTAVAEQVVIGDSNKLAINDPIIVLSSKTKQKLAITSGIVIALGDYINYVLPMSASDQGSPLFNVNGEVVAMANPQDLNSEIASALSSKYLIKIQELLTTKAFAEVPVVTYETIKDQYYYQVTQEKTINNIPTKVWQEYQKIGNIKTNIILPITKANYEQGIVSLRYRNDLAPYVSSFMVAEAFCTQLEKNGYQLKVNNEQQMIYENDLYQVTILDDIKSLIILLVRK